MKLLLLLLFVTLTFSKAMAATTSSCRPTCMSFRVDRSAIGCHRSGSFSAESEQQPSPWGSFHASPCDGSPLPERLIVYGHETGQSGNVSTTKIELGAKDLFTYCSAYECPSPLECTTPQQFGSILQFDFHDEVGGALVMLLTLSLSIDFVGNATDADTMLGPLALLWMDDPFDCRPGDVMFTEEQEDFYDDTTAVDIIPASGGDLSDIFDGDSTQAVQQSQRDALRSLFVATRMDSSISRSLHNWFPSNDDDDATYCSFTGVGCNLERYVVSLDLNALGLAGSLPSSLDALKQLQRLMVGQNQIGGDLPTSVHSLAALRQIDLKENKFTGTLSEDLSKLSKLERIQIQGNEFVGTIPTSFCELRDLSTLNLSDNTDITGTLPSCLGKLRILRVRDLALTGSVPHEVCGLANEMFGCDGIACPAGTFLPGAGRQATGVNLPCLPCAGPSNVIGSTYCRFVPSSQGTHATNSVPLPPPSSMPALANDLSLLPPVSPTPSPLQRAAGVVNEDSSTANPASDRRTGIVVLVVGVVAFIASLAALVKFLVDNHRERWFEERHSHARSAFLEVDRLSRETPYCPSILPSVNPTEPASAAASIWRGLGIHSVFNGSSTGGEQLIDVGEIDHSMVLADFDVEYSAGGAPMMMYDSWSTSESSKSQMSIKASSFDAVSESGHSFAFDDLEPLRGTRSPSLGDEQITSPSEEAGELGTFLASHASVQQQQPLPTEDLSVTATSPPLDRSKRSHRSRLFHDPYPTEALETSKRSANTNLTPMFQSPYPSQQLSHKLRNIDEWQDPLAFPSQSPRQPALQDGFSVSSIHSVVSTAMSSITMGPIPLKMKWGKFLNPHSEKGGRDAESDGLPQTAYKGVYGSLIEHSVGLAACSDASSSFDSQTAFLNSKGMNMGASLVSSLSDSDDETLHDEAATVGPKGYAAKPIWFRRVLMRKSWVPVGSFYPDEATI